MGIKQNMSVHLLYKYNPLCVLQQADLRHPQASSQSGCQSLAVSPSWLLPEWWCERSAATESWPELHCTDEPIFFFFF